MKMQKFAYALFSLTFLFSCSDENLPSGDELPLNMQKISNRIGVEEAINYVEEARTLVLDPVFDPAIYKQDYRDIKIGLVYR